jgi:hypothetical protein
MAKVTSGGGLTSNKLVRPGVKSGPANTNVVNPRGVSQYGHATPGKMRQGAHTGDNTAEKVFERKAAEQPLGNAVATNIGKGGPGTGRTTYPSGVQGTHGPVVPDTTPKPRDTWAEYPGRPTAKGR